MQTIPDSMALITCGQCRHTADIFEFCETPISGTLPLGTYQCPKCRKAWRMQTQGEGQQFDSGLYIPPKRIAVSIASMM
jgi:hypothetical protein